MNPQPDQSKEKDVFLCDCDGFYHVSVDGVSYDVDEDMRSLLESERNKAVECLTVGKKSEAKKVADLHHRGNEAHFMEGWSYARNILQDDKILFMGKNPDEA